MTTETLPRSAPGAQRPVTFDQFLWCDNVHCAAQHVRIVLREGRRQYRRNPVCPLCRHALLLNRTRSRLEAQEQFGTDVAKELRLRGMLAKALAG